MDRSHFYLKLDGQFQNDVTTLRFFISKMKVVEFIHGAVEIYIIISQLCLSVFLFVRSHGCLSVRLSVCPFAWLFVCPSVCLSVRIAVCLSVCWFVCSDAHKIVCLSNANGPVGAKIREFNRFLHLHESPKRTL